MAVVLAGRPTALFLSLLFCVNLFASVQAVTGKYFTRLVPLDSASGASFAVDTHPHTFASVAISILTVTLFVGIDGQRAVCPNYFNILWSWSRVARWVSLKLVVHVAKI